MAWFYSTKICGLLIILLLARNSKMDSYLNKPVTNWVFEGRLTCSSVILPVLSFSFKKGKRKKKKERKIKKKYDLLKSFETSLLCDPWVLKDNHLMVQTASAISLNTPG